jgi:hypothetical protein
MKQLFSDIIGFMSNLDLIDFLLYLAVLVLVILVVSLIYVIKNEQAEEEVEEYSFNDEDIDLKEVVNNIENTTPDVAAFTNYEEEQEEKAIISYDELVARNKQGNINYNEEEVINNEVSVKKIDLDNIIKEDNEIIKQNDTHLMFNYEKEEAFLESLKKLQELLN